MSTWCRALPGMFSIVSLLWLTISNQLLSTFSMDVPVPQNATTVHTQVYAAVDSVAYRSGSGLSSSQKFLSQTLFLHRMALMQKLFLTRVSPSSLTSHLRNGFSLSPRSIGFRPLNLLLSLRSTLHLHLQIRWNRSSSAEVHVPLSFLFVEEHGYPPVPLASRSWGSLLHRPSHHRFQFLLFVLQSPPFFKHHHQSLFLPHSTSSSNFFPPQSTS